MSATARRIWRSRALLLVSSALLGAAVAAPAGAEKKIRDNLFLLEEAYNQEPGVVQHILVCQLDERDWDAALTDEWPATGGRHQVSLTVPLQKGTGGNAADWGDLLVNYRLQALSRERLAWAPRLSLVLPTGDERTGAGRGGFGVQGNLPLSVELHPQWTLHLNAGMTYVPRAWDAATGTRRGEWDTAIGAAVVWLPTYRLNGLVEIVHQSAREGAAGLRESTLTLSPGVRAAIDVRSGLQVVPGLAVPIELRQGSRRAAVLLYLSIEHTMWK